MAIEKHGQITGDLRRVCVFIEIHKYIASLPVRSLNNLLRVVVERRFLFQNAMRLVYRVISSPVVSSGTRRIICARKIVRWLPAYPKFVSHAVP